MAAPDIIIISAVNYDVYELRATADTYFNAKLGNTSWKAASGGDKDKALVSATRMFDLQIWKGTITSPTQPLQWPRTGIIDRKGAAVPSNIIPTDILNGYYELAQAYIDNPELASTGNQDDNTRRAKAGAVEVEFFSQTKNTPRFPNSVQEIIKPYIDNTGLVANFASGINGTSEFICGKYDRTEGLA